MSVANPQHLNCTAHPTTSSPFWRARQLVLGRLFGVVFGFLLQKGGVARYEVLMGQFFLTDFTVIKVMLTAIVVGLFVMERLAP